MKENVCFDVVAKSMHCDINGNKRIDLLANGVTKERAIAIYKHNKKRENIAILQHPQGEFISKNLILKKVKC